MSHKIKHLQGGAGRTAGTCRDRRKISSPARVAGTGYKGGQEKASEVWAMKRKRPRPSAKTEDEADRRFFNEQFQPVQQELAALVTEIRHIRLLWGNLTKEVITEMRYQHDRQAGQARIRSKRHRQARRS